MDTDSTTKINEEGQLELSVHKSETAAPKEKRFNIEKIPLVSLFITTDKQRRIRLSSDLLEMYGPSSRISLGYDHSEKAIAIKLSASPNDPTSANIDKRGYVSATQFYERTKLSDEPRRYSFIAEEDGWLVFVDDPYSS